uniref:protein-serine/threonine phosphatase n=1 Tax=Fagus sylvatica TaxID=28930 RepID=A0A2N9H756_FAGSY
MEGESKGSSSEGRPPNPNPNPNPNPLAAAYRPCFATDRVPLPCNKSLIRHPSLMKSKASDVSGLESCESEFIPIVRSGAWADVGFRTNMEDVYVCVDDFAQDYGLKNFTDGPNALYAVFDGHGGKHAADFACCHLPKFIVEDEDFPRDIERVVASAFLQTDTAFAEACSLDAALASGTTALAALVVGRCWPISGLWVGRASLAGVWGGVSGGLVWVSWVWGANGCVFHSFVPDENVENVLCHAKCSLSDRLTDLASRLLVVANAGDCRAVLCRRGKAIEMSRDHKPLCSKERKRIEASGGYIYDGYLNGQLNVARALGDWHMEGMKGGDGGPLSAEPELMSAKLTVEDEFLIIGCDGIWDVFRSQNAVDFARRRLQEHNDPALCSKDLVDEALKRKSGDNLAAVVVCFQHQSPPNLVAPRSRVQRSFSAEGLRELQGFLDSLAN